MACCLRPAQALLIVGVDQSPIALSDDMESLLRSEPIRLKLDHREHNYIFDGSGDPLFAWTDPVPPSTNNAGTHYIGRQFHLHEPGEHPVDGHTFPLETHFVFDGEDNPESVLALGWLFRRTKGRSSELVRNVLEGKPVEIPRPTELYAYTGSLTTGDTNSNVNWLLNFEPLKVNDEDLLELKTRGLVQNARPVQDRAGRAVSRTSCKVHGSGSKARSC